MKPEWQTLRVRAAHSTTSEQPKEDVLLGKGWSGQGQGQCIHPTGFSFHLLAIEIEVVKGSTHSCWLDLLRGRCPHSYPVPQSPPPPNGLQISHSHFDHIWKREKHLNSKKSQDLMKIESRIEGNQVTVRQRKINSLSWIIILGIMKSAKKKSQEKTGQ